MDTGRKERVVVMRPEGKRRCDETKKRERDNVLRPGDRK